MIEGRAGRFNKLMCGRPQFLRPGSSIAPHPLVLWRLRHGLSQARVAKAIGVATQSISKLELYQRQIQGQRLVRLIDFTGLPLMAFVAPHDFLAQHPDFPEGTRAPPHQDGGPRG